MLLPSTALTIPALFIAQSRSAVVPLTQEFDLLSRDSQCANGPYTRACWSNGYSIATDFDQKFPTTGKTVSYSLEITNGTCNPDGHGNRLCFLINGQHPGPTIRATWGDTLSVTVKNSLQDNGTSMHWHGVRQYNSPGSDGVNGLTECPLAPGTSRTYTFQVTQFGTSWYHAHYSAQYGDGTLGTLIFDGPASGNYDEDLGVFPINEWYYPTAFQINAIATSNLQLGGYGAAPPQANNILINGTSKDANGNGRYSRVTMKSGKKYRLRLINTSVDNYVHVSLDNHPFSVITSDFVPIKPQSAQWLLMGMGQRYDVVITANQTAGNYWFRANVATACHSYNSGSGRAIFSYSTVTPGTPQSSAFTEPNDCTEPAPLTPYWNQPVPSSSFASSVQDLGLSLTKAVVVPGQGNMVVWALNSSIDVDWQNPTISYVMNGNTSYPESLHVLPTTNEGDWNYWLIQQSQDSTISPPIPHPIHLHGHDFFVLGQGYRQYSSSNSLNFANPTRRDTASIYAGGWLALAFNSNNPGTWLMHCHIAWHISEGLGLQFLEAPAKMRLPDSGQFQQQCADWKNYYKTSHYKKTDSGV